MKNETKVNHDLISLQQKHFINKTLRVDKNQCISVQTEPLLTKKWEENIQTFLLNHVLFSSAYFQNVLKLVHHMIFSLIYLAMLHIFNAETNSYGFESWSLD